MAWGNSTYIDAARVAESVALLKKAGRLALQYNPEGGFALAFSGGKDRLKRSMPKYVYPDELITSARLGMYARFIDFSLTFDEVFKVSDLDSMSAAGKNGIYGGGLPHPV